MKKFFLLCAAAVTAMAANAADWYISGAFQGWTNCKAGYNMTEKSAGVYELQVTADKITDGTGVFSGEFLIVRGAVNKPDWSTKIGTNGAKVKEGTAYKYTVGGGNFAMDGSVADATITLDTNTKTLLVKGKAQENEYTTVYLVGDMGGGWNDNRKDFPMTLKSGTDDTWTATYTLTAAKNYFKMRAGNYQYGDGIDNVDLDVELGHEYTAPQSGNSFVLPAGSYNFQFILPYNGESGKLTVTKSEVVTYPTTMYIIGNVNEGGFAPNNGIAMTSTEEGVFTGEALIGNEMLSGYGYFGFAEKLGASAADTEWSKMGARYGAASKDFEPVFTDKVATCDVAAGENSFKVAADKTFTFVLDLKNMKLTLTEKEVVPQPNKATIVYGDYKTYTPNAAEYTWTADGATGNEFVAVNDIAFKAGDVTFTGTQNEASTPCRLYRVKDDAASTTFRIFKLAKNKTKPSAYTVAVDNKHKINKIEIKVKGTGYPVNTSATTAKGEDGNGVMTWVAPEDQEVREVEFNGQPNSGGTVSILSATVYYDLSTAVETIIDNEADAPVYYYNLQGVRVENPSNGIFIRVQGKKSQKVMF